MHLHLDGQGPLYRQLTRALKAAIHDGTIPAGHRLPSTRDLAAQLGLGRNTVKAAFEQLVAEGYLSSAVGAGTFALPIGRLRRSGARSEAPAAPQSAYARRARRAMEAVALQFHKGLRFNFQYGNPVHEPAAIDAWRRELAHAASITVPSYPPAGGLPALRRAVADYLLRRRGIDCDANDVVIVSGVQQAMALAARVLLDEQDRVVLEEPHYFGARQVFAAHGATLLTVPTDAEGMVAAALPADPVKLVVATPGNQFPSGRLMSTGRRHELLAYAARTGCWILEDDYDGEFRFDSRPVPALLSLDPARRVIYAGTFSKVLFPSLRLGYMVVPAQLKLDFINAKYLMDMGNPAVEQAAMARYIESGRFEQHLTRVVRMARQRRSALLEGLERHGRGLFELRGGGGAGTYLVAWMPALNHAECAALIGYALDRGLGLYPIAPHYRAAPSCPGLMMAYTAMSPAEIGAATRLLGDCIDGAAAHGLIPRL